MKYGTWPLRTTALPDDPFQATDKRRCAAADRGYLDAPFIKITMQVHQALGE